MRNLRVVSSLVLVVLLVACGPDQRSALALTEPVWTGAHEVTFQVECAEDVEVAVDPNGGVDGTPLVTAWGRPVAGRCHVEVTVEVPTGTDRVDDAATGMIVDLPHR